MKVTALYRHPVKGLRPEALESASLTTGRGVEGDRAFAFQFLDDSVAEALRQAPAESAPWMSKFNLAMQHDWPALARVLPRWSPETKSLKLTIDQVGAIEESVEDLVGRERLARFISNYLRTTVPYEKARHGFLSEMRLIGGADLSTRYTDGAGGPVTLASSATFEDLGSKIGAPVDCRRFRLNLILDGVGAWEELKWPGRKLRVGQCVLEIQKPLGRCANIDVNPDTGERDVSVYPQLKPMYGHALTGVRAEVVQPGAVYIGDAWSLDC